LPYRQANWPSITDEELKRLVRQAIDAPIRGKDTQDKLTDR
jgi:hypothetical protein